MKVRVINTPKKQSGGSIYDPQQGTFSEKLGMLKSAGLVANGVANLGLAAAGTGVALSGGGGGNIPSEINMDNIQGLLGGMSNPLKKKPNTQMGTPEQMDGMTDLPDLGNMAKHGGMIYQNGGNTFLTSQQVKPSLPFKQTGVSDKDSFTGDEKVNTTVKPVDKEFQTLEAEAEEYIFSDKGLYKILGEKHTNGGTPLAATGGEFIFSAHKDMTVPKELQEKAGLKTTTTSWKDNTPNKILERNINVKEYNRLKTILENKDSDTITKKTAQFMLDKMNAKIQKIASLQESLKSQQPVQEQEYLEDSQISQQENEQKQYQDGGFTYPSDVNAPNLVKSNIGTSVEPVQEVKNNIYTKFADEDIDSFVKTHGWYFKNKGISKRDQLTPEVIGDFQKEYNKYYRDETGSDYFTGTGYRGYDNKLGKFTLNAPLFDYNQTITDQNGNPTQSYLTDRPGRMNTVYSKPSTVNTSTTETTTGAPLSTNKTTENPFLETRYSPNQNDPFAAIRGMQGLQYLNNQLSTEPLYTYTAPEHQYATAYDLMSTQPFEDEAAKSRYSTNQLASKFRTPSQATQSVAGSNQSQGVNDAFYKVQDYNNKTKTGFYNDALAKNTAVTNDFSQRMKQTHDQNNDVRDKTNFQRAAYFNQYSKAQQEDMLNKYYSDMQYQTAALPYLSTVEETDPKTGVKYNTYVGPKDPRWKPYNTAATNQMAAKTTSIVDKIKEYQKAGMSDDIIVQILKKES